MIVAESALIIEYLLEHFGKNSTALPKRWKARQEDKICGETEEYMRYRYFLHYGEGSLMSLMIVSLVAGSRYSLRFYKTSVQLLTATSFLQT